MHFQPRLQSWPDDPSDITHRDVKHLVTSWMEGSRRLYRGWQQIVIKGQRRLVKPHVGAYSISSCHIHSGDIPHQTEPHGSHQPITGLRPGHFPGLTINQWEALDVARTVITEGQWEREPSLMLAPKLGAWVKSLSETLLRCGVGKAREGNKEVCVCLDVGKPPTGR